MDTTKQHHDIKVLKSVGEQYIKMYHLDTLVRDNVDEMGYNEELPPFINAVDDNALKLMEYVKTHQTDTLSKNIIKSRILGINLTILQGTIQNLMCLSINSCNCQHSLRQWIRN